MKKLLGILALGLLLSGCAGRYSLFMESFSTGIVIQLIFFVLYFLPFIIGFFVLVFYASLTNVTSNVSVAEFFKGKEKRKR